MSDLSKIKIGNTYYNLKDAQGREDLASLIASLKSAAYRDVAAAISDAEGKIADAATVKAYVDAQIGSIKKFDVVVVDVLPTASADTMYKLYLIPKAGAASGNAKEEWITIRSGEEGAYTYAWEKIGDTEIDLTDYLTKAATVAGVAFGDDKAISANEIIEALGLGALAFKDKANGEIKVTTADSIEIDPVTVSGNAAVTTTATAAVLSKAAYTPAGTVNGGKVTASGTVNVTLKDAANATAAALVQEDYTPAGTITKPSINVTPSMGEIQPIATLGSLASIDATKFNGGEVATWTGYSHTAASLGDATKDAFAVEGMIAEMGEGDDAECLIFTAAATSSAVTAQGTFYGGSVNFGSFNGGAVASIGDGFFNQGALPTLGASVSFVTGATAELAAAPTFSGTTAASMIVTGVNYMKQVVDAHTFSGAEVNVTGASFSGTTVSDALVTGVTYEKADAAAMFSTEVEIEGDIVATEKTIDVEVE